MRALCLTGTGDPAPLSLLDLPTPILGRPDEVRIGVKAAALNHLDLFVSRGLPNVPLPSIPHIVGSDAAGVVLEVGSAVTSLQPGDRVVVNPGISCGTCPACLAGEEVFCRKFALLGEHLSGTAAEEIVVPARNLLRIEGEWSWPAAAAFTLSTLTAWRMLSTRAVLKSAEKVLIWGIGGGVALASLAIARHLGAEVMVTSSSPAKLAKAMILGADFTVNHAIEDVPARVKQDFGRRVDVVVDTVGTPTWPRSLQCLSPGGRLVTCGATGGHDVLLDLRRLFWFQWSLLGSTMGTSREFAEIVRLGNQGHLRPVVDQVFPLSAAQDAWQHLSTAAQFGKVVLEVTS